MARNYEENPFQTLIDGDVDQIGAEGISKGHCVMFFMHPNYYKKHNLDYLAFADAVYNVYGSYENAFDSDLYNYLQNVYSTTEEVCPEFNGNSHFKHQFTNNTLNLSAGKDATITLIHKSKLTKQPMFVNGIEVSDSVMVSACDKTYILPKDVNVTKLHNLVSAYSFAYQKLLTMPKDKVQDSIEFNLYCKCEKILVDMQVNKLKDYNFNLNEFLSPKLQEKINRYTEEEAYKKALQVNDLIPAESKDIKYPKDFNNFLTYVDKISPIYQKSAKLNPQNPVNKKIIKISQKLTKRLNKSQDMEI